MQSRKQSHSNVDMQFLFDDHDSSKAGHYDDVPLKNAITITVTSFFIGMLKQQGM
jgi:hypothetical protein